MVRGLHPHFEVEYHLTGPHPDLLENFIVKDHIHHIHLQGGQHRHIEPQGMVGAGHLHLIVEQKIGGHHLHIIEIVQHHHITHQEEEAHLQNGFLGDDHPHLTNRQQVNLLAEIHHTNRLQKEVMKKEINLSNLQKAGAPLGGKGVDQGV